MQTLKLRLFPLQLVVVVMALLTPSSITSVAARSDASQLPDVSPIGPPRENLDSIVVPVDSGSGAQSVEFVGHIGGEPLTVAVQGSYAYLGMGPRLIILDISDPTAPTPIGRTVPLAGIVQDIAVAGNYAYIAAGGAGLRIVDVSMPATPAEVAFSDKWGNAKGIAVAGNHAYVAAEYGGLWVVDISTPPSPSRVGYCCSTEVPQAVAIAGNYAYVAYAPVWDGNQYTGGGLGVVDVSAPSDPAHVGFYDTPGDANDVDVAGGYAYVADGDSGVRVVDVSTPSNPTEVGSYGTSSYSSHDEVVIAGSRAYVGRGHDLVTLSIAVPSDPTWESRVYLGATTEAMFVAGNYLYLVTTGGGWDNSLVVFDTSVPSKPTRMGGYHPMTAGTASGVAVAGDYAYVAWRDESRRFQVVDVSTPSTPTMRGNCCYPLADVVIDGNFAYIPEGEHLRVASISASGNLEAVGSYSTPGWSVGVDVAADYAYVAEGPYWDGSQYTEGGLRVVDISTPSNPYGVGFHDTPGSPRRVTIAGDYAYVADGSAGGLRVVDVSDPGNPVEIGFNSSRRASGLAVSGDYAYIAANGLWVVDISTPSSPTEVGFLGLQGGVDVAIAGDYAYVAGGWYGLVVADVSDPANPTQVSSYNLPGFAGDVAVANGDVYVADSQSGLFILRLASVEPRFSIGGQVHDDSNTPIPSVTIRAEFPVGTTTDASGTYELTDLVTGTYTLTPSKDGYVFEPPSRTVTVPPDTTDQVFTATEIVGWTLMFYLDGDTTDYDRATPALLNQLEAAANNPNVQAAVLWDGPGTGNSAYYEVQYDTDVTALAPYTAGENYWPKGELNMGSSTTLVDFVTWARTRYPARNYALILTDHGNGLGGAMLDETGGDAHLTVPDIGVALAFATFSGTRKIDVLFMDACLMGMIEVAFQVRDYVDYYVASENLVFVAVRARPERYPVSDITATMTPHELASLFATSYDRERSTASEPYTISAADISALDDLVATTNSLAWSLNTRMATAAVTLTTVIAPTVQRFDNRPPIYVIDPSVDEYIDLYDFARLVDTNFSNGAIRGAAQMVMDDVQDFIIAEYHQTSADAKVPNSHGVSIFFPSTASSFYNADAYDFATGASWPANSYSSRSARESGVEWGPMLVNYFQTTKPGGPDNPTPPELIPLQQEFGVYLPMVSTQ